MLFAQLAQSPGDPVAGWLQVIVQLGALGLLAYIVIVSVPKSSREAREERENRDKRFEAIMQASFDRFEERNGALAETIRSQTTQLTDAMERQTASINEAISHADIRRRG